MDLFEKGALKDQKLNTKSLLAKPEFKQQYRSATNLCLVLIYAIYANLTRSHKFVPHKFLFIHVNNSVRRSNALINI